MMARHTHIVSLGLFHKTFHSSLLQETFCFLMYDVLLSIYKINLIKKNKSCGTCVWQPLFAPQPFIAQTRVPLQFVTTSVLQHNTVTKILTLQKIRTFTRLVYYAFFTFHPQIIILFVLRDVFIHPKGGYVHDPSIKDKRVTKFYFDPFG